MRKYPIGAIVFLSWGLLASASLNLNDSLGVQVSASAKAISSGGALGQTEADLDFGKMPLFFVPNKGQLASQVTFYVQGQDKTLYFAAEGITLMLTKPADWKAGTDEFSRPASAISFGDRKMVNDAPGSEYWILKLDFVGARKTSPVGEGQTGTVVSYFKGKPEHWKTGLPTYSRLLYKDLWPGIDLIYSGTLDRLKYELIVRPGADPSRIRLAYRGAERVEVKDDGRLFVTTPLAGFFDDRPVAYQEVNRKKTDVSLAYQIYGTGGDSTENSFKKPTAEGQVLIYGFRVGEYDKEKPLVLDPAVLVYCGYIGGWGDESACSIAVDANGEAYVAGFTNSPEQSFPVKVGPGLANIDTDAFIAKVNDAGTELVYCGYVGGAGNDAARGVAVDGDGNAYVAGETFSTELSFPVKAGPDLTYNDWGSESYGDAFVAKVNSTGSDLVYCGYIGGVSSDKAAGIGVDGNGNAYVAGETSSREKSGNFPVKVGPDLSYNGGDVDAFIAKVKSAGTGLIFCGYIGGNNSDRAAAVAVDYAANAYITGHTDSTAASFPVAIGPDLTHSGNDDAFVAKVDSSGANLAYCGYVGGFESDEGKGIAVDGNGSAYLTGSTASPETTFPVVVGPDLTHNGTGFYDAFVAKVSPSGSGLLYCGYIGGSADDHGQAIAVDIAGNAYVAGTTWSTEASLPVSGGPDLSFNGTYDAFVAKVNPDGTGLPFCGYIGGFQADSAASIAVDSSGNAHIAGETASPEMTFPVNGGPDLSFNGWPYDAFVAKVCHSNKAMISGNVTANGSVLQGVVMSGLPGNPQTDSRGVYAAQVDSGWWGKVTPTRTGFAFSPPSRSYSNVTYDQTNQDYAASRLKISVSGHVKAGGAGIPGVAVTFSNGGGMATTDAQGYYSMTADYGWSGIATPSKTGYTFSPPSRSYSDVTSDRTDQDYAATLIMLSVSGYAKTSGAAGVQAVTISFSNGGGTATTDANGYYVQFVTYAWSGTATPSKAGFSFLPATRNYSNIISNQTNQDYAASLISSRLDLLGTWDGQGVYFRNSETGDWIKLASPAESVAAGDLDGDGKDDLIGVWAGQSGVWIRYSKNGAWSNVSPAARHISAGDMNGGGRKDLLGTWDGQGVFYRDSITSLWHKLATPAELISAGDLDSDSIDDLIGVWPAQDGAWVRHSKTEDWTRLAPIAVDIASGDMNGDGRDDFLGTWSGQGVFYRDSQSGVWVKMATPAEQVAAGDLDGDGIEDLIGLWSGQDGIWVKYSKTAAWSRLASSAQDIGVGLMRGVLLEGPSGQARLWPDANEGPGGRKFAWVESSNLEPRTQISPTGKPGPGEPGFSFVQQENLVPKESRDEGKSGARLSSASLLKNRNKRG
jgi:hypothetical protein